MYNVPASRKVCATCKWWRGSRERRSSLSWTTLSRPVTSAPPGKSIAARPVGATAGFSGKECRQNGNTDKTERNVEMRVNLADMLKVADRLISAYERSCELEVEKEKIAAELQLGERRIELEEKRLEVQYKTALKILNVESGKLSAALRAIEHKASQTKAIMARCDNLMKCISADENEMRRKQMLEMWMALHGTITQQLSSSSDDVKMLLNSGSQNLAGTAAKMLSAKSVTINAIEYGDN